MEKYIEQLKPLLEKVAVKIGEGTEFGWGVVIKQIYVEAVIGLFWALLGLAVFLSFIKFIPMAIKHYNEVREKDRYTDVGFGYGVLFVLLGIGAFIVFIVGTHVAITHFINPEFYALKFFIGLVK